MNIVILMGRLVDDVDVTSYGKGKEKKSVSRFILAVDRPGKDSGADFIRCVAFAGTADFASNYCKKGQRISIKGRWQTGSYDDKDGNVRYTNDCIVDNIFFADAKK